MIEVNVITKNIIHKNLKNWVNERTCPTNLIPIEAIIKGYDQDPHGILQFVDFVEEPANWDNSYNAAWSELFPQLNETQNELP